MARVVGIIALLVFMLVGLAPVASVVSEWISAWMTHSIEETLPTTTVPP